MQQTSFLYEFSSIAITTLLFVLIILLYEVGFNVGRFVQNRTDREIKSLAGAIQASILRLLALLSGFTFGMSVQRYDNRSAALISEANAIGKVQLRVGLLPEQHRDKASALLQNQAGLRIAVGGIDLTRWQERQE